MPPAGAARDMLSAGGGASSGTAAGPRTVVEPAVGAPPDDVSEGDRLNLAQNRDSPVSFRGPFRFCLISSSCSPPSSSVSVSPATTGTAATVSIFWTSSSSQTLTLPLSSKTRFKTRFVFFCLQHCFSAFFLSSSPSSTPRRRSLHVFFFCEAAAASFFSSSKSSETALPVAVVYTSS